MNEWLWALVIFIVVVTWLPAGVIGDRLFNFVVGHDLYDDKDSLAELGPIWLLLAFGGLFIKSFLIFSWVVLASIINFVVDIPSGGFPEWLKSQRRLSNDLRRGLINKK